MRFPALWLTAWFAEWHLGGGPDKLARLFIPTRSERKVILTKPLDAEPRPEPGAHVGGSAPGVRTLTPTRQRENQAADGSVSTAPAHGEWRGLATALGFVRVGVAAVDGASLAREAEAKDAAARWVDAGLHGNLQYMASPRSSPDELLPGARSVIVALAVTEDVSHEAQDAGRIAAYARGLDYHGALKAKLWTVAQQLCDDLQRPLTARVCVDTAPLLERFWAAEAGVTFTGKSTMAIAPGVGTNVVLGSILVDVELASNARLPVGCGECTLCIDACPTRAFAAPFVLDAGRCVATLTIENHGTIPEEFRAAVGDRVFGCDECQTVCPYNRSKKRPGPMPELAARPERRHADLGRWLTMTSGDYKRLTRDSALRRTPRAALQRNAAVALGNQEHATSDDLRVLSESGRDNPSALVREHATWALERLESSHADRHTNTAHDTERDADE